MQFTKKNDLTFWQFDLLLNCKEIVHGSFTREGGVSGGSYSSLNVSFDVGDNPDNVLLNRQKIQETLDLPPLKDTPQCHGANFFEVQKPNDSIPNCDALITNKPNIPLLIKHADCQAALFYDPIQKVIANVHAGWRGNVQKIYTKVIQQLRKLGSRPENILACLSPSLGPKSAQFLNYKTELPTLFWPFQENHYFDFWKIAERELLEADLLPHHIEIAAVDTFTEPLCFSYRKEKASGRLGTVITLKTP